MRPELLLLQLPQARLAQSDTTPGRTLDTPITAEAVRAAKEERLWIGEKKCTWRVAQMQICDTDNSLVGSWSAGQRRARATFLYYHSAYYHYHHVFITHIIIIIIIIIIITSDQ